MTSKKRGRPPGEILQLRKMLAEPPDYIATRITTRGGKTTRSHRDLLQSLDDHLASVESIRKSMRAKFDHVAVLLSSEADVPRDLMEEVDKSLPSWVSSNQEAQRARAERKKKWMTVVQAELPRYESFTAARAAELILNKWQGIDSEKPSKRTLRRFISDMRK